MVSREARHAAEPDPIDDSAPRLAVRIAVGLLAGALVFGLLVAAAVGLLSQVGDGGGGGATAGLPRTKCPENTITVAVDPVIADAVSAITADLSDFREGSGCVEVEIDPQPSAVVAANVARPVGVGLASELPDAWIADSSLWLNLARQSSIGQQRLDQTPQSIATSPLVLAVNPAKAEEAGWPDAQPTWSSMLSAPTSKWRLGTLDPVTNATGLSALLGVPRNSTQFATLGRRLELPSDLDQSPAELVAAGKYDSVPSAEHDVLRIAESGGNVVASYDPELGGALDFPLVGITPDEDVVSDEVTANLEALGKALGSSAAIKRFQQLGLRDPGGALASEYVSADGSPKSGTLSAQQVQAVRVNGDEVTNIRQTWSSVGRRSRLLVVLDLSGSMNEKLPGGTKSKIDLARQSLRQLVDASAPDSDLGLWTFTVSERPGGQDGVRKLVSVGALGDKVDGGAIRREELSGTVSRLKADPQGGTPLYRAVLEAYEAGLNDYAFGRYNAVVVVTDGEDQENDPKKSISDEEMLTDLRRQYDGIRPLPIITLGYGEGANYTILQRMSDVTGGSSYRGLTETKVTQMLTQALSASAT
ncbi:MAG: hypothetical protein ACRCYU_18935 [Nocardioides sp.]